MRNIVSLVLVLLIKGATAQQNNVVAEINGLMNDWHHAAATADEDAFFGLMADDCIYLGTDPEERWTKQEFYDWGLKYFQRDSAWVFNPIDRNIYFSEDGKTCWFEENLDTWMGECRGSGVLVMSDGVWKLKHYNLAVLIENELIEDYKDVKGIE